MQALAYKIAQVLDDYFVFDMPDIDDAAAAHMEMLSSVEGCYDVINQLLDIIAEAE